MTNKVSKLISQLVREALLEAQGSTGVRLRNEMQLAQEIAASIDEQEEEEEEEAAVEVDVEDEPPEGDLFADEPAAADEPPEPEPEVGEEEDVEVTAEEEPEAEPQAKRKMSTPSIATGLSYKDFKHNFNIIRSARALSKTINGEVMITKTGDRMRNYFDSLDDPEKKALQKFMVGLAQVLVIGKPAKDAIHPDIEKEKPAPSTVAEPTTTDVEIGLTPPIRVVGSKLEGLLRVSRRLVK